MYVNIHPFRFLQAVLESKANVLNQLRSFIRGRIPSNAYQTPRSSSPFPKSMTITAIVLMALTNLGPQHAHTYPHFLPQLRPRRQVVFLTKPWPYRDTIAKIKGICQATYHLRMSTTVCAIMTCVAMVVMNGKVLEE